MNLRCQQNNILVPPSLLYETSTGTSRRPFWKVSSCRVIMNLHFFFLSCPSHFSLSFFIISANLIIHNFQEPGASGLKFMQSAFINYAYNHRA